MKIVSKIDSLFGAPLRGMSDVLTGNYFSQIDKRVERVEKTLSKNSHRNEKLLQSLFDQNQERILNEFEKEQFEK